MGLLDFFSPPKKTDAVFGDLVYRARMQRRTVHS